MMSVPDFLLELLILVIRKFPIFPCKCFSSIHWLEKIYCAMLQIKLHQNASNTGFLYFRPSFDLLPEIEDLNDGIAI